jgi:arylsulfatase A-like enzyme
MSIASPSAPQRARSEAADVWYAAIWFGLVSGLTEGAIVSIIRIVPGWITWEMRTFSVSADVLWIAPLFNTILFLGAAAALIAVWAGLARVLRIAAGRVWSVAVFLFAGLTFYAAITATGRIYPWATLLLALGLAVQASRWTRARRLTAATWIRRTVLPLIAVVIVTAVTTFAWKRWSEHERLTRVPAADRARPNVLLLVFDTLRADHVSAYGYARPTTPHIDATARTGVLFENAFASAPWTVPSHASMFTGLHVYEHHADGLIPAVGTDFPILAEVMMSHGYLTGGFAANTWWLTPDSGFERGFVRFEDFSFLEIAFRTSLGREMANRVLPRLGYRNSPGRKTADQINAAFLRWLDTQDTTHPFFGFLNYVEVHGPYLAPEPYHTQFMDENQREREPRFPFRPPQVLDQNTGPAARALLQAGYDGSLAFLDAEVGKLLDELRRRGVLDNTLLILTSDHGEAFGEHGYFAHGNSLYSDQLYVPLIVAFPGRVPAGVRIPTPVCTRNIAATITAFALADVPPVLPGTSLAAYWNAGDATPELEPVFSEALTRDGLPKAWPVSQGWLKSLVTPEWHFILHEAGTTELYNRRSDPDERHDLAARDDARGTLDAFQEKLRGTPPNRSFAALGQGAGGALESHIR